MKRIINVDLHSVTQVVRTCLRYSDTFSFIVRNDIQVSKKLLKIIDDLSPFFIKKETINKWPGTELLQDEAKIYFYHLNMESAFVLQDADVELFNWVNPMLPEDLIFYRNNEPFFVSITHEKDAYFEINESEVDEIQIGTSR